MDKGRNIRNRDMKRSQRKQDNTVSQIARAETSFIQQIPAFE